MKIKITKDGERVELEFLHDPQKPPWKATLHESRIDLLVTAVTAVKKIKKASLELEL